MSTEDKNDVYVPGKGKIIREQQEAEENKIEANKLAKSIPNWAIDISKAQEIMNGDADVPEPGDKEWYPVGTIEEQEGPDQDNLGMSDDGVEQEIRADLSKGDSLVRAVDDNMMMLNIHQNNKCNNKEGIQCDGFRTMLELSKCVYIEQYGNKRCYVMWTLVNPELENIKHLDVTNIEELTKTRFSIPFKANRTLLKYCPECGGDLSF